MIDKSSLLKSQGSLYLEFIPKDGLFHKMLQLSLMGFLTGWCNLQSYIAFVCSGISIIPIQDTRYYYVYTLSISQLNPMLYFVEIGETNKNG